MLRGFIFRQEFYINIDEQRRPCGKRLSILWQYQQAALYKISSSNLTACTNDFRSNMLIKNAIMNTMLDVIAKVSVLKKAFPN